MYGAKKSKERGDGGGGGGGGGGEPLGNNVALGNNVLSDQLICPSR